MSLQVNSYYEIYLGTIFKKFLVFDLNFTPNLNLSFPRFFFLSNLSFRCCRFLLLSCWLPLVVFYARPCECKLCNYLLIRGNAFSFLFLWNLVVLWFVLMIAILLLRLLPLGLFLRSPLVRDFIRFFLWVRVLAIFGLLLLLGFVTGVRFLNHGFWDLSLHLWIKLPGFLHLLLLLFSKILQSFISFLLLLNLRRLLILLSHLGSKLLLVLFLIRYFLFNHFLITIYHFYREILQFFQL
jgi:hypothetical protein